MSNKKSKSRISLKDRVLDYFRDNAPKSFNHKQIASALKMHLEVDRELIQKVINDAEKEGSLKSAERGKYFFSGVVHLKYHGKIDMTASGSAFFICEDLENDAFIAPRKLRNALHGDKVVAYVFANKSGSKLEGEVVEILERARMEFTGIIKVSPRFAFVIPDNNKMNHDIFIPFNDINGAKDNEKVRALITEWPAGAKNPIGEVAEVLGKVGENNTEMNAILSDYGFPTHFPEAVLQEADKISTDISSAEIKKRKDFRKVLTFTIDPADAKDFDDAISYQKLANGNTEVGVHIADVSHYVLPETILEKEAYERATSVYLVDRVIPMLPEKLSNDLCSLRPNEDKLCFSAVFELDKDANVISEWFGRTIIHSDKRFAYEDVQEILDNKQGLYVEELMHINALAYKLRERKFKNGAIAFESTEVKFKLDENGKPIGVYVKERKDAHKLIEDFMLLANRKVAEFIHNKVKGKGKLTFVYRAHDAPDPEALGKFATFAANFGYKVSTGSHQEISTSLNKLMSDVDGKKEQNILTSLAIRSMAKAIYTTKRSSHYGLAFDYYTHFTSPIRRYPDVMVHRLLQYYLNSGKSMNPDPLEKACEHSSQQEKRASDAERASIKYKQAEYLRDNIGEDFIGVISGVTEWGIYVEIIENKCEGMVRLKDLDDDFYVLDPLNYCIIGQRSKKKYQLGDTVKVKVKKVDLAKRQLDFILLGKHEDN